MEQLVSPELVATAVSEQEVTNKNVSVEKPLETQSKEREALSSFDVEANSSNIHEKLKSLTEEQKKQESLSSSKATNEKEISNYCVMEKDNEDNPKISSEMQQNNEKPRISFPTSTNNTPKFNYKELIPYSHCCPLTLEEFCQYSNINKLVKEFCARQKLDAGQQRIILHRCYILFYLAPEHRNLTLFNKIQMLENCPPHIKEKFLSIPTRLYLKEPNATNASNEVNQATSVATVTQTNVPAAVSQLKVKSPVKNNKNNQQKMQSVSKATDLNVHHEINNNATEQMINSAETTHSTLVANSYIGTQQIITIPVTLDEFKKYTHYEEIVEKLFKLKAQNNEDLYFKYKNSSLAIENTLENYYRAFYFTPAIREIYPIRTKPMPNFLKHRLLSIPEGVNVTSLNNFKMEQLVAPELVATAVSEQEVTNKNLSVEKSVEKQSKEIEAANKSIVCPTSPPSSTAKKIKIENDRESLDNKSNLPFTVGSKRASNEVNESPSPKRQKTQQAEDNSNNSENTKQSYKELLPYAHCCPISFSQFCKYTNVSELFSGYCQKRYKSTNKLPFMLQRAYILYYLAPKNRSFKPFINLKVLDNCPTHLRDKIFEIPTNLYLKRDEKTNKEKVQTETETQMQMQTAIKMEKINTNEQQKRVTTGRDVKEPIKILENRLLSPAKLPRFHHSNNEVRCLNMTCVFHHIFHQDFMKHTNILSILPRPHEITIIQNTFKKFVYKIIKEQGCDDDYIVNGAFLCKLLKYKNICEKCENDVLALLSSDSTVASSESENERVPIEANKTITEECPVNNESLKANQTETLVIDHHVQPETTKQQHKDLCEYLRNDKIFSKFCKKLLEKLNGVFDGTVDFSSETHKILPCNEIPLRQKLNEFCDNKEDIVQRILNETELCDALQYYYYCKHLTNENNTNLVRNEANPTASQTTLTQAANMPKENSNNLTFNQEKISNSNNNALEKAKRIFFRHVEKTNTLYYVLRTSFGLKQIILSCVLSLTFQEFLENTSIYEGQELYADNYVAECMYRYVFHAPLVWPTNLYVKLEYLCEFLFAKNIRFDDYSTMLTHISPKLLHWSVLLACTNFVDCVKIDFERRTGQLLDTYDTKRLKEECIEYYNRCWKHEKWLGQVPLVNEEFYKDFPNDSNQDDVTMLDEPALQRVSRREVAMLDEPTEQRVCDDPAKISSHVVAVANKDFVVSNILPEDDEVEVTVLTDADRPLVEFNCVMLPNTQQQIEMLPVEEVSNDPLNDSNGAINLNNSSSTNEMSDEVVSVGELIQPPVKTEPIDKTLLSNLLFYEDDSSNVQCTPLEEEIYELDNTLESQKVGENLPPSQVDFEEVPLKYILSDVWLHSDSSNSLINLAQQPGSGEANNATANVQLFNQQPQTLPHLLQLPDVSLRSSGENDNPINVEDPGKKDELILEHDVGGLFPSSTYSGDLSAEPANTPIQREQQPLAADTVNDPLAPINEQQEVNIFNTQHPSAFVTVQPVNPRDQPLNLNQASLPKGRVVRKTNLANKIKKDIATVKPLHNAALVPQIQHNIRPLQTKALQTVSSSKDNNDLQPDTTLLKLSLTPTNNTSNPTEQPTKNASIQFQLSALGTHIYISQELNANCSVFDNTSLLRIADHNYYSQNTTILTAASPQEQQVPPVSKTTQPTVRNSKRRNSMCPNNNTTCSPSKLAIEQPAVNNTQPNTSGNLLGTTTKNVSKQQVCSRIVTRRTSSFNKDTNDKQYFLRHK